MQAKSDGPKHQAPLQTTRINQEYVPVVRALLRTYSGPNDLVLSKSSMCKHMTNPFGSPSQRYTAGYVDVLSQRLLWSLGFCCSKKLMRPGSPELSRDPVNSRDGLSIMTLKQVPSWEGNPMPLASIFFLLIILRDLCSDGGRFATVVKLNRGLRDSDYDQLYAYLKQHEAHANENKMMLDRFTQQTVDPLALMSNVSQQQYYSQSSTTPPSTHLQPQVDRIEVRGTMHEVQVQLVMGELRIELGMQIQVKQGRLSATTIKENGVALDEEQLLFIASGQDTAVDEDVDEQPVQDLALNVDNVFQADDCDAFDSDVDEAPTAQTMFMANLSSADPVYDEVGPSYDSDILSKVHDNDHYQDAVCEHHAVHEMHDDVQPNYVVDSHAGYTSDSNMIPYDQEQKINEQLRIVITDRNCKEENLKRELYSVKLQLTSTINHNKSMVEEVTSLKRDFKQKENKYLEEFLDMKALNEKVEDKLYKQDQSLQIVHMLCKPKRYYDEQNKVVIGYKNPLCLTRAKQVQPALYNGHEIIKTNHVPAIVHNSEDTLEIAKITKKKMNDKMKDPECVKKKVKIAPHDYSKKNYLATFTPQKQLTPEQIF
ncbi:hypothetical protein Tco_0973089 [Tanacetum coccineum]